MFFFFFYKKHIAVTQPQTHTRRHTHRHIQAHKNNLSSDKRGARLSSIEFRDDQHNTEVTEKSVPREFQPLEIIGRKTHLHLKRETTWMEGELKTFILCTAIAVTSPSHRETK